MCFMRLSVLNDVKSLLVDQIPCFLDDESSNAATSNSLTTSSVTASCNFCTSFGQEAVTEDVVTPLGVAALLGSSSKKQGI